MSKPKNDIVAQTRATGMVIGGRDASDDLKFAAFMQIFHPDRAPRTLQEATERSVKRHRKAKR